MSRNLYIVSDLHLGPAARENSNAKPSEESYAEEQLRDFLGHIATRRSPVELIVLGDAFDFHPSPSELGEAWAEPSQGTTQEKAVRRMRAIVKSHPVFFGALAKFIARGNRVRFLRGNHDVDLIWPDVQRLLRESLVRKNTGEGLLFCSSRVYRDGPLYCEHGNHYSADKPCNVRDRLLAIEGDGRARIEQRWTEKNADTATGWRTQVDSYERAAVGILNEKRDVQLVVFGHTHSPVDGNRRNDRLKLPENKWYFNSGSWTRSRAHGSDRNQDTSLAELAQKGTSTGSLDFVRVTFEDDGSVKANLERAGEGTR